MIIMALVKRITIQIIRDKRTLALMMIAPLILLTLVNFLFTSNSTNKFRVGVYETDKVFNEVLEENDIEIIKYKDKENIKDKIKADSLKAFINTDVGRISITYENSIPSDSAQIKAKVQGALAKVEMSKLKEAVQKINNNVKKQGSIEIENNYVYGDENLTFFDTLSPILIGFFVFFFVFLISGISLLKERTSKTLEKLLATSIKRREIILGYLLGYGIFAVIQTIIVVLFSIYVLNIRMEGNILLVILTNIIIAFVALSLGILLSTFANSEFQMMQFIPIIVVPQIFFTGLIPIDTMADWLQKVAHVMPLYYGAQALQGIMIKSNGINDVSFYLVILLLFAIALYILNVVGMKRYRKI
ncbi:ABC-2 type transport system permease protein [Clostridium cavendishii DSM 21758]|uniref:ABC-2 type transport system permease protein n=1 Tax=Clostridium cavendishii DSM 21758 TaxID=1121302 RepID=A0A1M6DIU4_9CLOT|nr:ABC transporter permease [Clostridium cavendishii]SHI73043.1 ABC-2 type transport system permease protein [Clostridium cavendishii DSM 21758]